MGRGIADFEYAIMVTIPACMDAHEYKKEGNKIMDNILKITGSNGTPFIVRRVNTGETAIEFYDARYPFTAYGQFISRYYAATLKGHIGGLNLHGGVPEWQVDAGSMEKVVAWIGQSV